MNKTEQVLIGKAFALLDIIVYSDGTGRIGDVDFNYITN